MEKALGLGVGKELRLGVGKALGRGWDRGSWEEGALATGDGPGGGCIDVWSVGNCV